MTDHVTSASAREATSAAADRIWPIAVAATFVVVVFRIYPWHDVPPSNLWLALQMLPVAVATGALFASSPRPTPTPMRAVAWSAASLTAVCCASSLWSADPLRTATQSVVLGLSLAFLYLTSTRRWPDTLERDLTLLFALGGSTLICSVVLRVLGVDSTVGVARRLQGVMGNPNYYAMLMVTTIAIGIYLLVRGRWTGRLRILIAAVVGLALVTLVWSGSRGSMLSFAVLVIGCPLVPSVRACLRRHGWSIIAGTVLGTVIGMTAWAVAPTLEPPAESMAHMEGELDPDSGSVGEIFDRGTVEAGLTTGRSDIWMSAVDLVQEEPILGHGYRTAEIVMPGQVTAHNVFLSFLLETGPVGLLALVALVGSLGWAGLAGSRTDGVLLLACGAIAVQEQVESSLQAFSGPVAILQWMLVFAFAASGSGSGKPQRQPDPRMSVE